MTKYIVGLFAAVALATASYAADAPKGPVVLKAKNGDVSFDHSKHADKKCEVCHEGGKGGKMELGKDKAHGLCLECHKKEAKGPAKCAECHKKA